MADVRQSTKPNLTKELKTQIARRRKAEQKLQASEERYRLLVEGAKVYAIFFMDTKGHIIDWNEGAEVIFGFKKKEILGRHFSIIFTKEDTEKDIPEKELQQAIKGGVADDDRWHVRKDGRRFWVSGHVLPLFDETGKLKGFSKVVRDLTDQKALERRKDEFLSTASHELKTPVTTIKGYTQLLQNHLKNDKKTIDYLSHVDTQVDRLAILINDLLDVSKVEGGKLNLRKGNFKIDDLAKEVAEDTEKSMERIKIEIIGKTKTKVWVDRYRICQVLINLINNALKFSPKSKDIVIILKEEQDGVVVSVQDFGIGIAKKNLNKVFDRLFQVDNTIRQSFSGLGLGLYIAAEIVKRHGGRIWVESEKGKGSTFSFKLPFRYQE